MAVLIIKPPLMHASISNNNKHIRYLNTRHTGLLRLGTTSNNTYRILTQFDLSSLPFLATIKNSTLNIFVAQNEAAGTVGTLGIFQIFSEWNPQNVTWNKQPLISSTPLDSIPAISNDNSLLKFNITRLVQDWSTNHSANFGIMLKLLDESHRNLLVIPGKGCPDSRLWPYLELNISDQVSSDDLRMLRAVVLEQSVNVVAQNSLQCTSPINILVYDYSYLVVNTGANPAVAYLQVSPNNANWQTESATKIINPGDLVSFVPDTIAKYARLCYQSQLPMQGTSLTIYIQGRSYS